MMGCFVLAASSHPDRAFTRWREVVNSHNDIKLTHPLSFHIHNTHNLGNLAFRHYAAHFSSSRPCAPTPRRFLVFEPRGRLNWIALLLSKVGIVGRHASCLMAQSLLLSGFFER
jgi:hypothetical protein